MADTKISALTAATNPLSAMELAINDAGASKKMTIANLAKYNALDLAGSSGAAGSSRTVLVLTSNSSDVTALPASAVTVMTYTGVGAGTWRAKGTIIFQTAATTTGFGMCLNHTGTTTRYVSNWVHLTTGAAAATGVSDQATTVVTGQMAEGKAERVKNTISSAMAGVDTANADELAVLDAVFIVTVTGSLELKIASEVSGSAVRLMAGTILELDKVA